ncbi:hypothetical protein DYQ94_03960 [Xanthomonas sp. LMG 8993]|nr:hypothetical protein AN651_10610 [Xanthomonas arboricola]MBB4769329.1 hypothetical protein [Xanthomonas arboricola]MXV46084.1 hypothetical protein [Xanthomonas sp. LMG 8993]
MAGVKTFALLRCDRLQLACVADDVAMPGQAHADAARMPPLHCAGKRRTTACPPTRQPDAA